MQRIDLTGRRVSRWTVLYFVPTDGRRTMWMCRCDCGVEKLVNADNLLARRTQSCGCVRIEVTASRSTTHGETVNRKRSKTYCAWIKAKERCYDPNCERFPSYGGRGITMCIDWKDSFQAFVRDMGVCPAGFSLERKDVNGDYCPDNCEWIPLKRQYQNKQNTRWVEYQGKRMSLSDCARLAGVKYKRLHKLFHTKGLPFDVALQRAARIAV